MKKATEKIFGYTRDEMLEMHWKDYVAPEHHGLVENSLADKFGVEGQSVYELNCITKDGRKITIEVNSCGIYKGKELVGVQGISRDITKRKQAEDALRESEERFRKSLSFSKKQENHEGAIRYFICHYNKIRRVMFQT